MIVNIDEHGYITSYAIIGSLDNGIEAEDPSDTQHFENNFLAYKLDNKQLVYCETRNAELNKAAKRNEIVTLRAKECFPVINRGQLWYDTLSENQKFELSLWYQRWLDATETMIIPDKPEWI